MTVFSGGWVPVVGGYWFGNALVFDAGVYLGTYWPPDPPVWKPDDCDELDYVLALPQPSLTDVGSTDAPADSYRYGPDASQAGSYGSSIPEPDAHLYVVWYRFDFYSDPADMPNPTKAPLDLVPGYYVAGGNGPYYVGGHLSDWVDGYDDTALATAIAAARIARDGFASASTFGSSSAAFMAAFDAARLGTGEDPTGHTAQQNSGAVDFSVISGGLDPSSPYAGSASETLFIYDGSSAIAADLPEVPNNITEHTDSPVPIPGTGGSQYVEYEDPAYSFAGWNAWDLRFFSNSGQAEARAGVPPTTTDITPDVFGQPLYVTGGGTPFDGTVALSAHEYASSSEYATLADEVHGWALPPSSTEVTEWLDPQDIALGRFDYDVSQSFPPSGSTPDGYWHTSVDLSPITTLAFLLLAQSNMIEDGIGGAPGTWDLSVLNTSGGINNGDGWSAGTFLRNAQSPGAYAPNLTRHVPRYRYWIPGDLVFPLSGFQGWGVPM